MSLLFGYVPPFRQEKHDAAFFVPHGEQREIHDHDFFAALPRVHLDVVADGLALRCPPNRVAQVLLRLRRDGPPECLPKRFPDDVVPRKTSAIQGRAVAFEQDAIRCEDTDQLKHLVQRDAGQLLQILLRRVV